MIAYFAAAAALGLLAGVAFARVWLRIVPHRTHVNYWKAVAALTQELLRVEEARAFLRVYGGLLRLLGPYLARNLGGMIAALLPFIVIALTVAPALFSAWDARAERRALVPAQGAPVLMAADTLPAARTAYCAGAGWCGLFATLGFEINETPEARVPWTVARAHHGDINPLWPFLSDLEAAFFAAFFLSMLGALLWPRPSLAPATTRSFS